MTRKFIFYIFLLPFLLPAQIDPAIQTKIDSLTTELKNDSVYIYRFRKIRPYLNYHERNSVDHYPRVNFFGPQAGFVLYERHIVGFGAYFSTKKTKLPFEDMDVDKKIHRTIKITYGTLFYQYILIQKRFYEFHIPVEVGLGNYQSGYIDSTGFTYKNINTNRFTMAGGGLLLLIKPFKWLGISNNFGYRVANESIINGFYYAIGVWIGLKPAACDIKYYLYKKKQYRKKVNSLLKT